MGKEEYFFYEWIICDKGLLEGEFENLSQSEFEGLKREYAEFKKMLTPFS